MYEGEGVQGTSISSSSSSPPPLYIVPIWGYMLK